MVGVKHYVIKSTGQGNIPPGLYLNEIPTGWKFWTYEHATVFDWNWFKYDAPRWALCFEGPEEFEIVPVMKR
jgi:hypothetical protein